MKGIIAQCQVSNKSGLSTGPHTYTEFQEQSCAIGDVLGNESVSIGENIHVSSMFLCVESSTLNLKLKMSLNIEITLTNNNWLDRHKVGQLIPTEYEMIYPSPPLPFSLFGCFAIEYKKPGTCNPVFQVKTKQKLLWPCWIKA